MTKIKTNYILLLGITIYIPVVKIVVRHPSGPTEKYFGPRKTLQIIKIVILSKVLIKAYYFFGRVKFYSKENKIWVKVRRVKN